MPPIIKAAQDIYQDSVPDLRDKTCPGVAPLLDYLRERGTVLALVTGNLTRIGWRKLERAGLDHYFRLGAFGEMAPTRGGLARLAGSYEEELAPYLRQLVAVRPETVIDIGAADGYYASWLRLRQRT